MSDHGFSRACRSGNSMDSIDPPDYMTCARCNGDGEITKLGATVLFDSECEKVECPDCAGMGKVPK